MGIRKSCYSFFFYLRMTREEFGETSCWVKERLGGWRLDCVLNLEVDGVDISLCRIEIRAVGDLASGNYAYIPNK